MSLLFCEVRKITFLNMKIEDFFKGTLTRECKRIKKKYSSTNLYETVTRLHLL